MLKLFFFYYSLIDYAETQLLNRLYSLVFLKSIYFNSTSTALNAKLFKLRTKCKKYHTNKKTPNKTGLMLSKICKSSTIWINKMLFLSVVVIQEKEMQIANMNIL